DRRPVRDGSAIGQRFRDADGWLGERGSANGHRRAERDLGMRSVPLLAAAKLLPLLRLCLVRTASLRAPLVALSLCPSLGGWPLCAPLGPSGLVLSPVAGAAPRGSPSARLHRAKDRNNAQALWLSRHVVRAKRARGTPTRRAGGIDPLRGRGATTARQPNNACDPTLAVWLDTCAARMQPAIDKPRFSPLKFLQ